MKKYIIIILLIIALLSIFYKINNTNDNNNEITYELSEIENGIYAISAYTVSSIPAQNYEMITICYNNSVFTIKGNIDINYISNNEKQYAVYKNSKWVHCDEVNLYIHKGSIRFDGAIRVG